MPAKIIKLILESATEGIFGLDDKGRHTFVNPAAAEMLGYEVSDLIGRHSHSTWHHTRFDGTRYPPEECPIYKAMLHRRICEGEEHFICKNGALINVEFSSIPVVEENKSIGGVVIFRDITKRKQAEKLLLEAKKKYQELADSISDVFFAMDKGLRYTYWNKASEKLTGIPAEKALGKTLMEIFPDNKSRQQVADLYLRTIETKERQHLHVTYPGDETFVHEISAYPTAEGVSVFVKDITQRKQTERALIETERLSVAAELASGVAHDFNNSLQVIFGNLDMALLEPHISQRMKSYIWAAKKSANDAASRVRHLQRLTKKKGDSEFIPLDINKLIEEAIEETSPFWKDEAEKKGLRISFQTLQGEIVPIDGDPGDLGSVFNNLIKNSVEAMPNGGTITFETGIIGKEVYIWITDTGMGMDEEVKKRIFQPYFSTKGLEVGRGLGMSSVRLIIQDDHQGKISVKKTEVGKGTTVEMLLPFGTKKLESLEKKYLIAQIPIRILWADDEPTILDIGRRFLEAMGHQVKTVNSGKEALELLEKDQYDLLISDVGMSGMSGWQLVESVRSLYPVMKIVVASGHGGDDTGEKRKIHRVNYFLPKPFNMEELTKMIGEIFQL